MFKNRAGVSNKNRPGGRTRLPKIIFSRDGTRITAFKNAAPPSQGRGQDGHDDSTKDYRPIVNEPRTNTVLLREALQKKTGITIPATETRQQRRHVAVLRQRAEFQEAFEKYKLEAMKRPSREPIPHYTRSQRRAKREEEFNGSDAQV